MEYNLLPENNSNLSQLISLISSETRKHLSDRYDDIKVLLKKYYEKLLDPKRREREIQELVSQIEDDFGKEINEQRENYIKVNEENIPDSSLKRTKILDIQFDIDNLVREEGLVTDTEATNFLENKLKKVLINQGKSELANKIRVCISNRGELLNAYVYADGTIVISQYLIKSLGSLDQVFGVLFHEVVHKEREHFVKENASLTNEIEADVLLTCQYLNQARYNSQGLLKAIATLESLSDDSGASMEYLSFFQRRALIRELHKRHHFPNSNKKETSLPQILDKNSTLTNNEIFKKLSKLNAIEELSKLLPKISKRNLELLLVNNPNYTELRDGQFGDNINEIRKQLYPQICDLISLRLKKNNISEPLVRGFLLLLDSYLNYSEELRSRINNQDELLESVFDFKIGFKIFIEIFGDYSKLKIHFNGRHFLNFIFSNVKYSKSTNTDLNDKIPVEGQKLVEIIEKIRENAKNWFKSDSIIISILIQYCSQIKLEDASEVRKFLEIVKNSKFSEIFEAKTLIKSLDDYPRSLGLGKNYTEQELAYILFIRELSKLRFPKEAQDKEETLQDFHQINLTEDQEFVGILKEFFDIQKPVEVETESDPLIVISQVFSKMTEVDSVGKYLSGNQRDNDYSVLFTQLNQIIEEKNLSEEEVFKLIEEIFTKIDLLPFSDLEFVKDTSKSNYFKGKNLTQENINKTIIFSLKLRALIELSRKDSKLFYDLVNRIMIEAGNNFDSCSVYDLATILSPLINNDLGSISNGNFIGFESTPPTRYASFRALSKQVGWSTPIVKEPYPTTILELESLENLPLVKKFLDYPMPDISFSGTPEEVLKNIQSEVSNISNSVCTSLSSFLGLNYNNTNQLLFAESLIASKLLLKYRKAFLDYIKNTEPNFQNYEQFFKLILILPYSKERQLIIRKVLGIYLYSEKISYEEKLNFAITNYGHMEYEDILYLSELIPSDENNPGFFWENWLYFKASFSALWEKNIKDKKSKDIELLARGNALFQRAPVGVLETAIMNQSSSVETSTNSACGWFSKAYRQKFLLKKNVFCIDSINRPIFQSLRDDFISLKNMSLLKRVNLTTTALTNEVRERGGIRIGEILTKIFDSDSDFLNEFISTASGTLKKGKSDLLITTMGYFSAKNLFQNLDVRNVNLVDVKNFLAKQFPNRNDWNNLSEDELRKILDNSTRRITLFAPQFQSSESSIISPILQDNDNDFFEIMEHLTNYFNIDFYPAERTAGSEEEVHVPRNVENLISALEMTILGTRGLQMSGQMYNFADPDIRRRVSRSFDANPGLDRIDFLLALDSASERDPVLNEFLRTRLIGIKRSREGRDSLGGGSMATVYLAEVIDGETHKPVLSALRCLVPNAVEDVNEMYTTLHVVFEKMEKRVYKLNESFSKHRRIIRDSRIGKLVLEIAKNWCIQDLEDPDYEVNDDRFREEVIDEFLRQNPSYDFVAPKRIYSSEAESEDDEGNKFKIKNWVRIESLAPGVTVRKFLESPEYSDDLKREVITQIYNFNMFQYNQIPGNGEDRLVQSDPSIGNYHIEIIDGKPRIHVLDRGLMIKMDRERAELFRNFANEGRSAGNGAISAVGEAYLNVKEKLQLLKLLIREVLKENNKNNRFVVSLNLLKSITNSVFFKEAREIYDIVLAVNESFAELGLKIPISIQLPIKNITGWKMLMKEWSQK